jgi:hypothetical protein
MNQQPNYGEQAQGWRWNDSGGGGGGGGGGRELFWGAAVLIAVVALVIKFAALLITLVTTLVIWWIAYRLWRRANNTAGASAVDRSAPTRSKVIRATSVVFIAVGVLILAGGSITYFRGDESATASPAATAAAPVPSTIGAGTAGSDADVFVAAGACDIWAADACEAITSSYAAFYTGIWACLREPESCNVDAYTTPGSARDYLASLAADFTQRGVRVSSTIDVGYAVITSVSSLPTGNCGGSTCVTVSSCWWNSAVSTEPSTEPYSPNVTTYTTTIIKVDGEWKVESDSTGTQSTDQADCPTP